MIVNNKISKEDGSWCQCTECLNEGILLEWYNYCPFCGEGVTIEEEKEGESK